jgi:hypothetical protein
MPDREQLGAEQSGYGPGRIGGTTGSAARFIGSGCGSTRPADEAGIREPSGSSAAYARSRAARSMRAFTVRTSPSGPRMTATASLAPGGSPCSVSRSSITSKTSGRVFRAPETNTRTRSPTIRSSQPSTTESPTHLYCPIARRYGDYRSAVRCAPYLPTRSAPTSAPTAAFGLFRRVIVTRAADALLLLPGLLLRRHVYKFTGGQCGCRSAVMYSAPATLVVALLRRGEPSATSG